MATNHSNFSIVDLRQATAELLACAVLKLFPTTLLIQGESTDLGFYYDFVFELPLLPGSLTIIEEEMRSLIKESINVKSLDMMRENAANLFEHQGQYLQASVVMEVQENIISVIQIGDTFFDYCPLPHIQSLSQIGAFKLQKNVDRDEVLSFEETIHITRISGTAFFEQSDLKQFLKRLDAAEKQSHFLLGQEMDLFSSQEVEGGLEWLWHPKGVRLRDSLIRLWEKQVQKGRFEKVLTPPVVLPDLSEWIELSRAPQHALIYQKNEHGRSRLPIRYCEWVNWIGNEGEAEEGLFSTYSYSGDFETVFCLKEQLESELNSSLQFILGIVRILGIEHRWVLSHCHQEFSPFSPEERDALSLMKKGLEVNHIDFELDEVDGEKSWVIAEVRFKDAIGREWVGPYVELDFDTPKRLELVFQERDGVSKIKLLLAWSMFGSLERLVSLLIERYEGKLPLWMMPEQVRILAVSEQYVRYAQEIAARIDKEGFRVDVDYTSDKLGTKIHKAERNRIPYILIVGDKEESRKEVAVRTNRQKLYSETMKLEEFLEVLRKNATDKEESI